MKRPVLATIAVLTASTLAGCSSGRPSSTASTQPAPPAPLVASGPGGITGAEGPYPVVEVLDADALVVERGPAGGRTAVALLGVVTPDTARCFAGEALGEARRLLEGQRVRIVADPGRAAPTDAGGRPLVYVWLDAGRMANDVLVEVGVAREATGTQDYLYRGVFARSEELARHEERGLWAARTCAGNITKAATS